MNDPFDAPPTLERSLELVRLAKRGDQAAFDEFCRRYHDRLLRIVRIVHPPYRQNLLASMDVVQETFVVALRRIHEFEPKSHGAILRWLKTIAERKVKDDQMRHDTEPLDRGEDDGEGPKLPDRGPEPQEVLLRLERRQALDDCVASLPPRQRDVYVWREYCLCTMDEVWQELELQNKHVAEALLDRARDNLEECLQRKFPDGI